MEEKTILKLSLGMILLGLLFLYFYAESIELPSVAQLDNLPANEPVKIHGIVRKVQMQDKVAFLQVDAQRLEKMDVILFQGKDLYLKEGDYVEIEGTMEEYQGKKEVIGTKVVLK